MTCDDDEVSIGAKPEILAGSGFPGGHRYILHDSNDYPYMRNTFIAYMAVPADWSQYLRSRVEGSARQCWAEGYRAAGYATLAGIVSAAASHGATASAIPAFVIQKTQAAITSCLQRESTQLGVDLASNLTPHVIQVSGGWTDWQ